LSQLIDADVAGAFADVLRALAEWRATASRSSRAVIAQSARRLVPRHRVARMQDMQQPNKHRR
jgi:hypothetical protein